RNKGGRGGGVKANVVQSSTSGARRNDVVSDVDRAAVTGLNNDEWETLKNILNATKIGSNEKLTGKHTFIQWIYDSGASHRMTGWLQCMSEVRDITTECSVGLPNGKRMYQLLDDYDGVAQFTNKFCVMQDCTSRMLIGAGEQREGLYFYKRMVNVMDVTARDVGCFETWHKRLGHPSSKVVESIPNISINNGSGSLNKACDVCLRAKQSRDSFPISNNKTTEPFQLIHCDLWGPYRSPSFCGARYFLTVVDDYSRATRIYLLIDKRHVSLNLCNFIVTVERQFNKQVKVVRSENETEFICMDDYFCKHGILHETSCVGTPQQNGRVERKHRHILNVARALRFQSNLPIEFWWEVYISCFA
ncbi:retrovirus-related pol polyprotein from transposon TNT 1-94, partial [Tanacetum coccineum]